MKRRRICVHRHFDSCRGTWNIVKELRGKKKFSQNCQISNEGQMGKWPLPTIFTSVSMTKRTLFSILHTRKRRVVWEPNISLSNVERELMSLNKNKSVDNNSVDAKFLCVGQSIESRSFPTRWKMASAIGAYQYLKNSSLSTENYLPISFLHVFSILFKNSSWNLWKLSCRSRGACLLCRTNRSFEK